MTGILLLTAAVAAMAQQYPGSSRFYKWDKDNNKKITHAEFYEGMKQTGIFERWDRNEDKLLDRQEVNAGKIRMQQLAEKVNTAGQGQASAAEKQEFTSLPLQEGGFSYQRRWGGEAAFSFREVDLNRDGTLDKTEFFTALFRLWDRENSGFLRTNQLEESQLRQWMLSGK